MSKELIEQLAKEHGFTAHDPKKHGIMSWGSVNTESLEAFAKAYAQTQGQSIPDYHVISDSGDGLVAVSQAVAQQLLCMRDLFETKDYEEAYTCLINLADPNLCHINVWQDLERIAAPIESGVKG